MRNREEFETKTGTAKDLTKGKVMESVVKRKESNSEPKNEKVKGYWRKRKELEKMKLAGQS